MKGQNHYCQSLSGESVNRKKYSPFHSFTYSPIHLFTQKGISLIEILMIIVVVSIAIPALLILIGGEAGRGVEPELRITATNVAQQLMDQIMTKNWDHNIPIPPGSSSTTLGPDDGSGTETTLASYNDVDDFNDLAPGGGSVPPCTDQVTVNNVTFTREVKVCYVNGAPLNTCVDNDPAAGSCSRTIAAATDYKKITVTVTAPGTSWGSSVVLTTVMTNY